MKFRSILTVVAASVAVSSCMWTTWIGYDGNFQGRPVASSAAGCPAEIGVQNLDEQQAAAAADIVSEVCDIFAQESFADRIRAKTNWLASCKVLPDGSYDTIAADEVVRIIRLPKDSVSILDRRPLTGVAQIDPGKRRIAVPKAWLENWQTGTRLEKGEVIETFAHELTHFVRDSGDARFRFQDGGWKKASCGQDRLASYSVGRLAETHWLEQNPEQP